MSILLTQTQYLSADEIQTIKANAVSEYVNNNPPGTVVTAELLATISAAALQTYLAAHPGTAIYTDQELLDLVNTSISNYLDNHPPADTQYIIIANSRSEAMTVQLGSYSQVLQPGDVIVKKPTDFNYGADLSFSWLTGGYQVKQIVCNGIPPFNTVQVASLVNADALTLDHGSPSYNLAFGNYFVIIVSDYPGVSYSGEQIDAIKTQAVADYFAAHPGTIYTVQEIVDVQNNAVNAYLAAHPGTIYTVQQITDIQNSAVADYLNAHPGTIYTAQQIIDIQNSAVADYVSSHPVGHASNFQDALDSAAGAGGTFGYSLPNVGNTGFNILQSANDWYSSYLSETGLAFTDDEQTLLLFNYLAQFISNQYNLIYTPQGLSDYYDAAQADYVAAHPGTVYTDQQITDIQSAAVAAYLAAHPGTIYTETQISDMIAAAIAQYVIDNPCPGDSDTTYTVNLHTSIPIYGYISISDSHSEDSVSENFDQYVSKDYTIKGEHVNLTINTYDKNNHANAYPCTVKVDGVRYESHSGALNLSDVAIHSTIELIDPDWP